MKKIAFHLNCLEQGGAERVVSNLAGQFVREGYEVYIATEWEGENEFAIDPAIHRVHVGLRPEDASKGRIRQFLLRVRYLKAFMKEVKPDVLCAFAQRANYRALMACPGTGVPVVISIRTDPTGHYDALSDKIQIPLLFPRAAGCVFQTTGQKAFFKPYLQDNSRIILNPVNPKYIGVPGPEIRDKSVVQSARLVDFKNQPMLLEAFFKVHEKHPDYVLKIYGPDSFDGTREILEKMIKEHQAQDYILLMGGSDSLEKELPRGAVFAFSSDWEGLPNALMEAMALGMPIVATDCPCGGPATILQHEVNGLLVPIKDPEAMAAGICRLIEDRELAERLGKKAREIKDIAGAKEVFLQWQEYLEQVIRNAG